MFKSLFKRKSSTKGNPLKSPQAGSINRIIKNQENLINIKENKALSEEEQEVYSILCNMNPKTQEEYKRIKEFLLKNTNIPPLNKANSDVSYAENLNNILKNLGYEHIEPNSILSHIGEPDRNYYILLRGEIYVLMLNESYVELSEHEFVTHLAKLRTANEHFIADKIIKANYRQFSVTEHQISEAMNVGKDKSVKKITSTAFKLVSTKPTKKSSNKLLENLIDDYAVKFKKVDTLDKQKVKDIQDILKRTDLDHLSRVVPGRKRIKLYSYYVATTLTKGEVIVNGMSGDASADSVATIVTKTDSHFAFIPKKAKGDAMREIINKMRRMSTSFIFSLPLFSSIANKKKFENRCLLYFLSLRIAKNQSLLQKGVNSDSLFLLKSGEYQVSAYLSIKQIEEYFREKGYQSQLVDIKKERDDPKYAKLVNDRMEIKLVILKNEEIVGFEEFNFKGVNVLNVKCVSNEGEGLRVDRNVFE